MSQTIQTRKLSNWIDSFLQYTNNSEPPFLYRKWTAISCIASALQRKVKINWGSSLVFYPNFYIVLVGPSATGKGTAMRPGIKIIREIPGIKLSAQATSLQALIRHLKDNNLTDINIETNKQTYHSSLTVCVEEFTVFLGYNNLAMISALCNWYDCEDHWSYETISRRKEEIIGVWFNLIAGATPDLIRSSLPVDSIGSGLTSRIIFIYEEKPDKLISLPTETDEERELFKYLVYDLEQISLMSGEFKWTKNFAGLWNDWRKQDRLNPPFNDSKFDGYNGRRKVHLMKLAMIVNVSRGDNKLILSHTDLEKSIAMLEEAEIKMSMTFKGSGKSDISELIYKATMFLKTSKMEEVPVYMFARHFEGDMDKLTIDRVLSTLETAKIITILKRPGMDQTIKLY